MELKALTTIRLYHADDLPPLSRYWKRRLTYWNRKLRRESPRIEIVVK